jgi:ketosteroid isomerase-like protein
MIHCFGSADILRHGALVCPLVRNVYHAIEAIFRTAATVIPFDTPVRQGYAVAKPTVDRNRERAEETMQITRRDLTVAGALALSVPTLLFGSPALADAGDEAAVKQNVEALREALLKADKAQLERLTADQLSYGHSDGRVQNKPEFIDGVMTRKARVKSINFPDLKIAVAGDAAIARHLYESESEMEGKTTNTRIGALEVWQKQGGNWKLLARQAYKLA